MCYKKIKIVFVVFATTVLAGCAGITTEEFGRGVQAGSLGESTGALSPVIWLTGVVIEGVGANSNPKEYHRKSDDEQIIWRDLARKSIRNEFNKRLAATSTVDQSAIKDATTNYCAEIDSKIAKREAIGFIKRGDLVSNGVKEASLPPGDNNMLLPFSSNRNPFRDCVKSLSDRS